MACPLCDHEGARPSWLGSTFYQGREFPYVQCSLCESLYCDPMPDGETLAQMYGPSYEASVAADPATHNNDPKEPLRIVEWLKKVKTGTFLDYGCGAGALLTEAAKLNWQAIGVEFDNEVVEAVARRTGARVVDPFDQLLAGPIADVVHLGDVVEHLTEMNRQMPRILQLIKPGGLLLAQGPLENNASLFTLVVRSVRSLRRGRVRTEMAPYHVLLATASGQKIRFDRVGLEQLEYSISEVAWPAPARLSRADLIRPRPIGLFVLRRFSQAISALRPGRWGNRYFYAGRWHGHG
jgi:SAM-dependent methyltransferase